jgi:hypothetical protein
MRLQLVISAWHINNPETVLSIVYMKVVYGSNLSVQSM